MPLDSRDLRAVFEIAQAGSVTRAAERLHVTQSAISHHLRALEARVGTPLFLRDGRRMLPTPAGAELVRAAERVLEELRRADAVVDQLVRQQSGEVRLAAQCHTGYHWLPALLTAARTRFPQHTVRILAEHTTDPVAALLDARLDMAVVNDAPDDRRLRLRPLFEDEHAAIVWTGHPWTRRAFVTADDFASARLLLYSRSLDDSFVARRVLRPAGVVPAEVSFIQLTEALIEMVKAQAGVTILPTWSVAPALAAGDVAAVRITRGGVFRPWLAATLAQAPPSKFVDFLTTALAASGRRLDHTRAARRR